MFRYWFLALSFSWSIAAIPSPIPMSDKLPATVTITPQIQQFYYLEVSGGYHLTIEKGNTWGLSITGNQEDIDKLIITQNKDLLSLSPINEKISFISKMFNFRDEDSAQYQLDIKLTVPALANIRLLGSSSADVAANLGVIDITLSGDSELNLQQQASPRIHATLHGISKLIATQIRSNNLQLDLHGSSEANILDTSAQNSILLEQSGSSKLNIGKVRTRTLTIAASGSSKTGIGRLESYNTYLDNHGSSVTTLNQVDTSQLYAKLSGSSVLNIHNGKSLKSRVSSTGNARFNTTGDFDSGIMKQEPL